MDYVIRPLTPADEPILWEMLYQALQTSEGAPPRDIVWQPQFARHAEGWGRAGDIGFVAYDAKQKDELLGAVEAYTYNRQEPLLFTHGAFGRFTAVDGK